MLARIGGITIQPLTGLNIVGPDFTIWIPPNPATPDEFHSAAIKIWQRVKNAPESGIVPDDGVRSVAAIEALLIACHRFIRS